MEIIKATEEYKGKELVVSYLTDYYYDVKVNNFCVEFVRTPFHQTIQKKFTDSLLADWLSDPELYLVKEKDQTIGLIEISLESWNNRLRISNLWIHENYRHQGIGTQLIKLAEKKAIELNARSLVLETQSCNDHAISFYLKNGFQLIGFDLTCYSNKDIDNKEVRLEMGKAVNK